MRKLSNDEIYLLRKQVVRMKEQGLTRSQIEELTGVLENRVSQIWSDYKEGGLSVLKPKISGRKKGSGTKLTAEQEAIVRKSIIDKAPDQYKMRFMLWTREAVCGLIKQLFGIDISLRCITNYLRKWGMTCQRPTKRAYFCDNVKLDRFIREEYPSIAKRAKEEHAEIYWGDETGLDNREHYARGFAPKGQPPVIAVESKKERVNMMSALTNKGKLRFMFFERNVAQQEFIEFMRRMIHDVPQKVFFIVDNLKVHHGKKVQEWLEKHKERIEVFYLPPYAPEINPDEYFNNGLKHNVHKGVEPRTKKDIKHKAEGYMRKLQHKSALVEAFFHHPKVAYAKIEC